MKLGAIQEQVHGYRGGHQLLRSSVRLSQQDQDLVDHLSDAAGPLRPGETFSAYLSTYPLPSSEFYALARTEQDLEARRSGCVRTRTLLVPMEYWVSDAGGAMVTGLRLLDVNDGSGTLLRNRVPELDEFDEAIAVEIVETIFVEKRESMVVFGALFAEAIVFRLLMAIWPSMRRSFSVCTFALAPRSLCGRSFDLQFAPMSARVRFSDWEGRRIDRSSKERAQCHRWAEVLTDRVFVSRVPYLANTESLSDLAIDEGDLTPSVLRLTLLWEELLERSESSPTAVLGLIDIARSRDAGGPKWARLGDVVSRAIERSVNSLDTEDAWDFLCRLLRKLEDLRLDGAIVRSLRAAGAELARRDWQAAFRCLRGGCRICSELDRALVAAISVEIAGIESAEITEALATIPPDRLVKMALFEDSILRRMFVSTDVDLDEALVGQLTEGLRNLSEYERLRHMARFLPYIRGNQDAGLLAQLLVGARFGELARAVESVWGDISRRTRLVGEVLCSAAESSESRLEACKAFANVGVDYETDRCIIRLLGSEPEDVQWVLDNSGIGDGRRGLFLKEIIQGGRKRDLKEAFRHKQVARLAVDVLLRGVGQFAPIAARVVRLGTLDAGEHLTLGLDLVPLVVGKERTKLVLSMVARVLGDRAAQGGDLPGRLSALIDDSISVERVIRDSFGVELDGKRVTISLVGLDKMRSGNQMAIRGCVGRVVGLIASRQCLDLGEEGIFALARMIDGARGEGRQSHVKMCSRILPLALAAIRKPVSGIVTVAFPVVYEELRNGRHSSWLEVLFEFFDWDRCKVARRELVDAFLVSDWPPLDLAITAYRACDLRRILKRLLRTAGGAGYLDLVEGGAKLVPGRMGDQIVDAIGDVRREAV